jgi:hypothetical protein
MLWGAVHLAAAVASALIILAFLAERSYLHHAGEDRLSPVGLPFVAVGSTLLACFWESQDLSGAGGEDDRTPAVAASSD